MWQPRLKLNTSESIPRLAWLAEISEQGRVEVHCGPWVWQDEDVFFEGAWAGGPGVDQLASSSVVIGSGGYITESEIVVVCPSHTVEGIFWSRQKNSLLFSNSLPFLLAYTGQEIDHEYLDHEFDVLSIADGVDSYVRDIKLLAGPKVYRHYYTNIRIGRGLRVTEEGKQTGLPPKGFTEYRASLTNTLQRIVNNLAARPGPVFEPIVFCSNGYDSPACAVLAREVGCKTLVTYETSRSNRSDSGRDIARMLGYEDIIERHDRDYLARSCAAEFVATGELGTGIFMAASEDLLAGRLFLSGLHGDKVWKRTVAPSRSLVRSYFVGTAKKEFRLRVGFIEAPVPFFGAEHHESIFKISNSESMAQWRVDHNDDRPIPRRIVEEAGVPRDLFGWGGGGGVSGSFRFGGLGTLKKNMPAADWQRFRNYVVSKPRRFTFEFIRRSVLYMLFIGWFLGARVGFRGISIKVRRLPPRWRCSPWAPSLLFPWGASEVAERYRTGLVNGRP